MDGRGAAAKLELLVDELNKQRRPEEPPFVLVDFEGAYDKDFSRIPEADRRSPSALFERRTCVGWEEAMSHYQDLERDLFAVLAEVGPALSAAEKEETRMYLEAGEYGLALETVCAVLKRQKKPVSASVYVNLSDLGERMNVEARHWRDLEII